MNTERRRGQQFRWALVACLALLFLAAPAAQVSDAHAPLSRLLKVPIRLEGAVFAISGDIWTIANYNVHISPTTVIDETKGRAEVGAWVVVFATHDEADLLQADLIQVERGAPEHGPTNQYSGLLQKQSPPPWTPQQWVVAGTVFLIDQNTVILNDPQVGDYVQVAAEQQGAVLHAVLIDKLASSPEDLPVEFEGVIEEMNGSAWVIQGSQIEVPAASVIGDPAIGKTVEARALLLADQTLQASLVRVLDSAETSAAALADEGLRSLVRPNPSDTNSGPAAAWSEPHPIATGLAQATNPVIVYMADGTGYAVWDDGGTLYYAISQSGEQWSAPARVAAGACPSLVVDGENRVHLIFGNQFMGNNEIYYVTYNGTRWSLPTNVSHTTGDSFQPVLVVAADGQLQAAWVDTTPGYETIYHGVLETPFWTSQPVPNVRGRAPALAAAPDGTLFLAWQDQAEPDASTRRAVFLSERTNRRWSLPLLLSDSLDIDAYAVSLVADFDSRAHAAWVEDGNRLRYRFGRTLTWSESLTLATSTTVVREPKIAAEGGAFLHIAWDEGDSAWAITAPAGSEVWPPAARVIGANGSIRDIVLTLPRGAGAGLGWVQVVGPGDVAIYESVRPSVFTYQLYLPHLWHN